jgi:anti-sigma factor RsiW
MVQNPAARRCAHNLTELLKGSWREMRLAMMAMNKKSLQVPLEVEALLPWHVAGTLDVRDTGRVEQALGRDPLLAKKYAAIREEHAEIIALNEDLGAPSARVVQKLFAAIDAEPVRRPPVSAQIGGFLASMPPRTLAWSAALAALLLLLQAGVIGAFLARQQPVVQATSWSGTGQESLPRALVRFDPDARLSDIAAFLDARRATVIDSAAGGIFRLQFGDKPMSRPEIAAMISRLQNEKIVNLAIPAQ